MAAERVDSVRVATWNLWWRFGAWQERHEAIAQVMAEVDADVWALQEVWAGPDGSPNQAELLADRLLRSEQLPRDRGAEHGDVRLGRHVGR